MTTRPHKLEAILDSQNVPIARTLKTTRLKKRASIQLFLHRKTAAEPSHVFRHLFFASPERSFLSMDFWQGEHCMKTRPHPPFTVPFTSAVNGSQPKHKGCAKRDGGFWSPAKHSSGLERPLIGSLRLANTSWVAPDRPDPLGAVFCPRPRFEASSL